MEKSTRYLQAVQVNCEIHNELVFQGNNLTLDEIYPSEKCRAWNMTLPCPVPEKALKAVMIGGPSGSDAGCPYLPTKPRLEKWTDSLWSSFWQVSSKNLQTRTKGSHSTSD